jgi:hypothetical protein
MSRNNAIDKEDSLPRVFCEALDKEASLLSVSSLLRLLFRALSKVFFAESFLAALGKAPSFRQRWSFL